MNFYLALFVTFCIAMLTGLGIKSLGFSEVIYLPITTFAWIFMIWINEKIKNRI